MATAFPTAAGFVPVTRSLRGLAGAAAGCQGCDLHARATQTVFGRGPRAARLMLVGEQPGDAEDTAGEPFVGPAGKLLDRALDDAGLAGEDRYVTNAVKHFRWKAARGRRRIHDKPSAAQSTACRPWLSAELDAVRPAVLVALGATAATSLFGPGLRVTQVRGATLDWPPERGDFAGCATPIGAALATVHPSSVLRARGPDRDDAYAAFVEDLKLAARLLHRLRR